MKDKMGGKHILFSPLVRWSNTVNTRGNDYEFRVGKTQVTTGQWQNQTLNMYWNEH